MNSPALKKLLTEYDSKRRKAILIAEEKKQACLNSCPDLVEIEKKLVNVSIQASKSIVLADSSSKLDILKKFEYEIDSLKKQKEKIIKLLGKGDSFLEPIFECNLCKDTGYVFKDNKSVMCSCLKQRLYDIEYNKSNIGNLDKENFSTFDFSKYSNEVNREKYNSDISPRKNISIIKNICENFIKNFDNPNEQNLLFTGNTRAWENFFV